MPAVKKPSIKKLPKKPKASASLAVLKKYKARYEEVEKHNKAEEARYKKDLATYAKLKKEVASLKR